MNLRMMKAMFDCDSHFSKKLTMCLNELSLVPSVGLSFEVQDVGKFFAEP